MFRGLLFALFLAGVAHGTTRFVSLFDGQSFAEHWEVKARPEDAAKGFWKVEDGAIHADSMGHTEHDYVWLVSKKEYTDFILIFRFATLEGAPGNSGVQLRSRYDDAAYWLDGPQIDIHPPGPWRTGMMWDETRGNQRWIFPNLAEGWVEPEMALNPLQMLYSSEENQGWNELRIVAEGPQVRAFLNGTQVTDFDGSGILDDAVHAKPRVGQRGHLALQIHKFSELKIWFKDIRIQELETD